MNVEKKLEYFTSAINKEAETKKRNARKQMQDDFKSQMSSAQDQAKQEAEAQIQVQKQAIDKLNNKRLTEAANTARRSIATLKERLTAQLFDQIKTDMVAKTMAEDYESFLINSIKTAQAKTPHLYKYIQLTPSDMALSSAIKEATGLTPESCDPSIIGGFKLLNENRSIVTEHTFSAKITESRQEFSAELAIIGEEQQPHA